MAKPKSKGEDRLEALHASLTEQVTSLTASDKWQAWLDTAAKFYRYSFNNQMLIAIQRPDATLVASYGKWQEMKRQVRKGEKSIGIFAPCTRKVENPHTHEEERRIVGFRIVSVFDVAQTDGDDLPEQPLPTLLDGEAPHGLWDALAGMIEDNRYTLERGDCGTANGWTQPRSRTIRVRDDVSEAQAVKTLIHEVAHMFLHTGETGGTVNIEHRGTAEVEAESVAYLVAKMHGLPTEDYTLPYVASWAGKDGDKLIRETAERVIKMARRISDLTLAEAGAPVPVPA